MMPLGHAPAVMLGSLLEVNPCTTTCCMCAQPSPGTVSLSPTSNRPCTDCPLQLLGGLLEVNPGYVRSVEQLGLASQFFEFLSLEHSNNNVHNIRLCRQIIAGGGMPIASLVQMGVAEKVAAVLEYAAQNNVEPFLEPA